MKYKVIVFELPGGIVAQGTSDLVLIDSGFFRVGKELYNHANVCLDTISNRAIIQAACDTMKRLEKARLDTMFQALNNIQRKP